MIKLGKGHCVFNGPGHAFPGTWYSLSEIPKDGTRFDVLCHLRETSIIVENQYWGKSNHSREFVIRGDGNDLGLFLDPVCWRKRHG